jgi:hypothetical protein
MLHYDPGIIDKYEETVEGFLRIFGTIAKVGWLDYVNQDGTLRKEYVSEDVLFDPVHLKSIKGAVLTLGHPPEMVTPENYSTYTVGATGTQVFPNEKEKALDIILIVNARSAIDAIQVDGIRGLSMGYFCNAQINADGTFSQKTRICNHNSIVEEPRCKGARLQMDGWYQSNFDELVLPEKPQKVMIPQYRTVYHSMFTSNTY